MSEPWDADVFREPDLAWQTQPPPARHAVPLRYVPGLDAGAELTIGLPGRWFIDGQVLARVGRERTTLAGRTEEQESVAVAAPFAWWLAQAFPRAGLTMQWWPVADAWYYRDAVSPGKPDVPGEGHPPVDPDGPGVHGETWLDHVRPTMEDPPVRHPRPAREAGSLTGRPLRLQDEPGSWSWWVAVGEPVDHDGDFAVPVMRPRDYWLTQVVFEPDAAERVVPLHRVWVYD